MKTNLIRLFAVLTSAFMLATAPPVAAVVFTSNTTINTGDTTYDGQDIAVSGCTLTVNGPHAFNSLSVTNAGTVTHSASVYGSVTNQFDLTIAADAFIGNDSAVDVSGKGYGSASGPGNGVSSDYGHGGGAGHGGTGGMSVGSSAGGPAYDSISDPVQVGSGGGTAYQASGGAGGGAVRLVGGGR